MDGTCRAKSSKAISNVRIVVENLETDLHKKFHILKIFGGPLRANSTKVGWAKLSLAVYVTFIHNVSCQKLFKSATVCM